MRSKNTFIFFHLTHSLKFLYKKSQCLLLFASLNTYKNVTLHYIICQESLHLQIITSPLCTKYSQNSQLQPAHKNLQPT